MIYYLYQVRNLINNRSYIGVTCKLRKRLTSHRNGYKSNANLQKEIKEYGVANFAFETLASGSKEEMMKLEAQMVIPGVNYNFAYGGENPPRLIGDTNPLKRKEVRDKVSKAKKGIKLSTEAIEKIRIRASQHRHTEKTKELISQLHRQGKLKPPPIHRGDNHPSKRPDVRAKMSQSRKGLSNGPQTQKHKDLMRQYHIDGRLKKPRARLCKKVKCLNDGLIFQNMQAAADYYKIDRAQVSKVANKKKPPTSCRGLDFEILEVYVKWD